MNDIQNLEDIKTLVDNFYGKVREDDVLRDIFNNKIQDRWPAHLEKMYVLANCFVGRTHLSRQSIFASRQTSCKH